MIYAKIFVEKDTDGTDVIVFDSSVNDEERYLRKAGKRQTATGGVSVMLHTVIYGYEHIAISPEAREILSRRLSDLTAMERVYFPADFELGSDGYFSFRPDDVKAALKRKSDFPDAESCGTVRRLRCDEHFRVCVMHGSYRQGLNEMIEIDNELLRTLDISTPVDPDDLR